MQEVLQTVLDLPALEGYFHPTQPQRRPLRVLKNNVVAENVQLSKFGEPVQLITPDEARQKETPYFEFTQADLQGSQATVAFRYAVEGIRGKVRLERDGSWKAVSHEIVEQ